MKNKAVSFCIFKRKRIVFCIAAVFLFLLLIGAFWYTHPTHFSYNDRFVIGNTQERIVEKYGEFDRLHRNGAGEVTCGIYMIRDNTPELVMSYDDSLWYEIDFEDGIAVKVRLRKGVLGG